MSRSPHSAVSGAAARRPRSFGAVLSEAAARLSLASASPRLDGELLLARVAGVSRSTVLAFPERELGPAAAERLDALIARRADGEPLAYLLGDKDFFTLTLDVGPAVLVPRPETEHLVDEVLARLPPASDAMPAVLDLGTGSGALALAVKQQRPDVDVTGVDSSAAALAVARANGARLGLDVRWIESRWFDALGGRRYDAILCNPPYVRSDDPHFAGPLRFEPRAALDGGPDGLGAIRAVLDTAPSHLVPGGLLLLEHGYDQQRAVAALAAERGLERLAWGRDLGGRDRYLVLGKGVPAA
jgi:release factor glutamine methyltransferase